MVFSSCGRCRLNYLDLLLDGQRRHEIVSGICITLRGANVIAIVGDLFGRTFICAYFMKLAEWRDLIIDVARFYEREDF